MVKCQPAIKLEPTKMQGRNQVSAVEFLHVFRFLAVLKKSPGHFFQQLFADGWFEFFGGGWLLSPRFQRG